MVGVIKFLADKSGSHVLWWAWLVLSFVLIMHVQSYIRAEAFDRPMRNRIGDRFYLSKTVSTIVAFGLTMTFIILIDNAIVAIAAAQLK